MLKLVLLLPALAALALAVRPTAPLPRTPPPSAAQDTPEVRAALVRGGIHMLQGQGGNVGLCIGEDGVLMIDDQYPRMAGALLSKIGELADGRAPSYLINTHHHGDHTGSNPVIGKGAVVFAHENVRRRLLAADDLDPAALPEVTYVDEMSLHLNGETIRLIHYPGGHTDGDTVVLFEESRVAHLGDLYFSGMFPYVDLDSGGSVHRVIAALWDLSYVLPDDVRIIPGHGPLSDLDDLRASLDMMQATSARIMEAKAEGDSVREIQAAGLAPEWREWAWNFITVDRWIDIVYNSPEG